MTREERISQIRCRIAAGIAVAGILVSSSTVIGCTYKTIKEVDKLLSVPVEDTRIYIIDELPTPEFAPVQYNTLVPDEYIPYILNIGQQYNISPELILAIIESESAGDPDAVSSSGCVGLMQIKPKFAVERMERLGVTDLYDPYSNILVGVDIISEFAKKYYDVPVVLMAYNEGEYSGAVEQATRGEYSAYATKIMSRTEELEEQAGKKAY